MSATNHTTNYNLPQFIGTDKPTWLTDVNGALNTIDTQMKANADSATSASTSATTANTNIGTLANLETTAKTDAVSAINEVNTKAGNAQSTANTAVSDASNAQTTANLAKTEADALASFVNINSYTNWNRSSDFNRTQGTGSIAWCSITVAKNSDGSLCKIYGGLTIDGVSAGGCIFKLIRDTGLRPTNRITVNPLGFAISGGRTSAMVSCYINTDGTLEFEFYGSTGQNSVTIFPCVLWVKDFGDTPTPNA